MKNFNIFLWTLWSVGTSGFIFAQVWESHYHWFNPLFSTDYNTRQNQLDNAKWCETRYWFKDSIKGWKVEPYIYQPLNVWTNYTYFLMALLMLKLFESTWSWYFERKIRFSTLNERHVRGHIEEPMPLSPRDSNNQVEGLVSPRTASSEQPWAQFNLAYKNTTQKLFQPILSTDIEAPTNEPHRRPRNPKPFLRSGQLLWKKVKTVMRGKNAFYSTLTEFHCGCCGKVMKENRYYLLPSMAVHLLALFVESSRFHLYNEKKYSDLGDMGTLFACLYYCGVALSLSWISSWKLYQITQEREVCLHDQSKWSKICNNSSSTPLLNWGEHSIWWLNPAVIFALDVCCYIGGLITAASLTFSHAELLIIIILASVIVIISTLAAVWILRQVFKLYGQKLPQEGARWSWSQKIGFTLKHLWAMCLIVCYILLGLWYLSFYAHDGCKWKMFSHMVTHIINGVLVLVYTVFILDFPFYSLLIE